MKKYFLILPFLLCINQTNAQNNTKRFDTTYVIRYNHRLAVSLYQSQKTFENEFRLLHSADTSISSNLDFFAPSNQVTGITVAYDKISLSLGVKTPITQAQIKKQGVTKYADYGFAFTTNRYRLDFTLKNYVGFYDANTANYDTNYTDTSAFFQRPDMTNLLIKVRGYFFFNKKKFSWAAAYSNTYRQVKTAGTFFAYSDFYYNDLNDPKTFIPSQLTKAFGLIGTLKQVKAVGSTLGGGYSFNLVLFKSLYVNGTLGLAAQLYQQTLKSADGKGDNNKLKFGITGADIRAAVGYNAKNFFISLSGGTDLSVLNIQDAQIFSKLIGANFNLGYRFPFKERNWVKKMKEHRLYKKL